MKKIVCVVIIFCMMVSLVGCNSKKKPFALSYDIKEEPRNLDPQTAVDLASLNVINNIFEGLFVYDQNGKIKNGMIVNYTLSNDKTTYTFKLRTNVKWTDNDDETKDKPVTAHDYVFAFQRLFLIDTNAPSAKLYYSIKNAQEIHEGTMDARLLGVTAKNDDTLVIMLEYPNENLLNLLAKPSAMPCNEEFFVQTKGKYGLEKDTIQSNGAFSLVKWEHNESMRLENNNNYYDKKQVMPTSISLWIATKTDEQLKKEQETDIIIDNTIDRLLEETIVASVVDGFNQNRISKKGFNTEPIESSTWGIAFNLNNAQLKNKNIRTSIARLFDRSSYQEQLPQSLLVANAIVPNSVVLLDKTYREYAGGQMTQSFNVNQANQLYQTGLNELDQKKISGIRLMVPKNENVQLSEYFMFVSQIIQSELGIFIGIDEVSQNQYHENLKSGTYDMALVNISMSDNSPRSVLEQFSDQSPKNYFGYHSAIVNQNLDQAAAQTDIMIAADYYKFAEQAIIDDAVFIPMFYKTDFFVTNQSIRHLAYNQQTGLISFRYAKKS